MIRKQSVVGGSLCLILLVGLFFILPHKPGIRNQKEVYSFINEYVYTDVSYPQTIQEHYINLSRSQKDYFSRLMQGVKELRQNQIQKAWYYWWACLNHKEFKNFSAETYLVIGKAIGERDGFASYVLFSKAHQIACSKDHKNKALEYVALNSIVKLLAAQAEDDEVIQQVDVMARDYSLDAHHLLKDSTNGINELNPASSIYRFATESVLWLGDDELSEEYIEHFLEQQKNYNNPALTDAYADILTGISAYIHGNMLESEIAFANAIKGIGNASSYLNYNLELPYAYQGAVYIEQKRYSDAIDYMERSIKTLQSDYYKSVDEPLKLIDPEKMKGRNSTYNILLCYLRLQAFYKMAINAGDTSIDLNKVLNLAEYTNQLIKVWFVNAADEETLLRATKLMKKSNSNAIDLIWSHQDEIENAVDKVFRLQTEAQSFYLNYLIELRKQGKDNAVYDKIRTLTLELANARQSEQQLTDENVKKQLALLRHKSALWSSQTNELDQLFDKKEIPNHLASNKAVIKYFMSFDGLYVSYFTGKQKGWKKLPKADYKNIVQRLKRAVKSQYASKRYLHRLYDLLIEPLENELQDVEELTILSDEQLEGVPFELLQDEQGAYLINHYAINYSYSSRLENNKQEGEIHNFLALAPGFEKDNNFSNASLVREVVDDYSFLERSGGNRIRLSSIPFSTDEVNTIGQLFKDRSINNEVLTRDKATTANFVNHLSNAGIIHIATHGISKDNYNSGLFFSQSNEKDDGFLSFYELYNLDLKADLVVLSACKSGIGKVVEGEGVMALSRGFIYAGASNVIASLWKVHDEKTKELMVSFYNHLLKNKMSYAQALKQAKLDCIQKGFSPLDWAGFVLISN
ncbi:CHAT domain-containing protein [Puteibacter caeruleilacunae]|nr:CHAT domain-containing protein [Puteibacter caeruleilacunae]